MTTHPLQRLLALLLAAAAWLLPAAHARGADVDRDGLDDGLEDQLLARHAPVVLLAPGEQALPASVAWTLARAPVEAPRPPRPRVMHASVVAPLTALLLPDLDVAEAHLRLAGALRDGSAEAGEWRAYGHAYRAPDGGVLLGYWFFYPFNDAFWAFDHEGDWEHVTVRLDASGRPLGAWFAQHGDCAPGRWSAWSALAQEGGHPVVLSARGTHASYPSIEAAPLWERVCAVREPSAAAGAGCRAWHTLEGGVVNMGERGAPREGFVVWPGRWGATGGFGREGPAAAPEGPAFQPGWCAEGAPGACP
ncbi:MAG: Vps62-related protein [Anaeromyxobacter sp.]